MRILSIGDIHGCLTALETLTEAVGFTADDTVITLGDYVDRGPDTKGVIDFVIDLQKHTHLVPLRGNHEIMMESARKSFIERWRWIGVGGEAALLSYGTKKLRKIPPEHWEFIGNCLSHYETESHFFVHANAVPDLPIDEQPSNVLYWRQFGEPEPHFSHKIMVCGHTVQRRGYPVSVGHAICIDTGAYAGGWLTCLDVTSGQYWQANQRGETRNGILENPQQTTP